MLFSDQKRHNITIPATDKDGKPVTVTYLIDYLCKNTMKDSRKELFVLDNQMYVSSSLMSILPDISVITSLPLPPSTRYPMRRPLLISIPQVVPASSCSSTMPIGSSRAKRSTRSRTATTSCSCRRFTVVKMLPGGDFRHPLST
jgi:hypothetical protein